MTSLISFCRSLNSLKMNVGVWSQRWTSRLCCKSIGRGGRGEGDGEIRAPEERRVVGKGLEGQFVAKYGVAMELSMVITFLPLQLEAGDLKDDCLCAEST